MTRPAADVSAIVDDPTELVDDPAELVVLDAHGVVFNRAFPTFVRRRSLERHDDPDVTWARWRRDYRLDFWEGRSSPNAVWRGLFPGDDPEKLTAGLHDVYDRGPLFDQVVGSDRRAWLLSNHYSGWLLPQLRRFGLDRRFERVLVSDQLGVAKPSPDVFEWVRREADTPDVVLLDDSATNVTAARRVGLCARRVVDPSVHDSGLRPGRLP